MKNVVLCYKTGNEMVAIQLKYWNHLSQTNKKKSGPIQQLFYSNFDFPFFFFNYMDLLKKIQSRTTFVKINPWLEF